MSAVDVALAALASMALAVLLDRLASLWLARRLDLPDEHEQGGP